MIEVTVYRQRIGVNNNRNFKNSSTLKHNDNTLKKSLIVFSLLCSVLLIRAGIESNPGPCIICGRDQNEKLLTFTEKTLNKCKESLAIRQTHSLKFSSITIPDVPNCDTRYHTSCYRAFNAIMNKYKCSEIKNVPSVSHHENKTPQQER